MAGGAGDEVGGADEGTSGITLDILDDSSPYCSRTRVRTAE